MTSAKSQNDKTLTCTACCIVSVSSMLNFTNLEKYCLILFTYYHKSVYHNFFNTRLEENTIIIKILLKFLKMLSLVFCCIPMLLKTYLIASKKFFIFYVFPISKLV